jgi:hypothetical protein
MFDVEGGLPTVPALAFGNVYRPAFETFLNRGLYTEAPKTVPGRTRVFKSDDLIAVRVLGELLLHHVTPAYACEIANAVHRMVRKDHLIDRLSTWKVTRRGKPRVVVAATQPEPQAIELFRFEIADIRYEAVERIRTENAARQAAKRNASS